MLPLTPSETYVSPPIFLGKNPMQQSSRIEIATFFTDQRDPPHNKISSKKSNTATPTAHAINIPVPPTVTAEPLTTQNRLETGTQQPSGKKKSMSSIVILGLLFTIHGLQSKDAWFNGETLTGGVLLGVCALSLLSIKINYTVCCCSFGINNGVNADSDSEEGFENAQAFTV